MQEVGGLLNGRR